MRQFGLHVNVRAAMQLALAEGLPVQALEELGVLFLHVGEEFITANEVRCGHSFVDQACADGSEAALHGLMAAHAGAAAHLGETTIRLIDAQAAAIPQARFAFINAHGSNDFIDHARDQRGADDR